MHRIREESLAGADENRIRLRDDQHARVEPEPGWRKPLGDDELGPLGGFTADGDKALACGGDIAIEIEMLRQDSAVAVVVQLGGSSEGD